MSKLFFFKVNLWLILISGPVHMKQKLAQNSVFPQSARSDAREILGLVAIKFLDALHIFLLIMFYSQWISEATTLLSVSSWPRRWNELL